MDQTQEFCRLGPKNVVLVADRARAIADERRKERLTAIYDRVYPNACFCAFVAVVGSAIYAMFKFAGAF